MKILTTTLLLACLSAVCGLQAQFEKKDWLVEGGFQARLEGSFGKKDIDLSQGGFTYYDTDSYGLNIAVGKFFWERQEMGLVFEENWNRQQSEEYRLSGIGSIVRKTKNYTVSQSLAIYFRQYFDFGKGWYGGFLTKAGGRWASNALFVEEDGTEGGPYGSTTTDFGLQGNVFVAKWIGKHIGGRISFGNIGYYIGTRSNADGIWYSRFDFNFQNLITPNISIFWTFHGKSKNDRD